MVVVYDMSITLKYVYKNNVLQHNGVNKMIDTTPIILEAKRLC